MSNSKLAWGKNHRGVVLLKYEEQKEVSTKVDSTLFSEAECVHAILTINQRRKASMHMKEARDTQLKKEESSADFIITVTLMSGSCVEVACFNNWTILQLKQEVERLTGVPRRLMQLFPADPDAPMPELSSRKASMKQLITSEAVSIHANQDLFLIKRADPLVLMYWTKQEMTLKDIHIEIILTLKKGERQEGDYPDFAATNGGNNNNVDDDLPALCHTERFNEGEVDEAMARYHKILAITPCVTLRSADSIVESSFDVDWDAEGGADAQRATEACKIIRMLLSRSDEGAQLLCA
jgi:hypothetical protein